MHKKQIIVLVVVFAIMGVLFFMPVKGLIKKDDPGHSKATVAQARPVNKVDVAAASAVAKTAIGQQLSAQITDAETQLKNTADEAGKLNLEKKTCEVVG
jgi:hypothetical protein